jgi:multiple sugar transport system permease protein
MGGTGGRIKRALALTAIGVVLVIYLLPIYWIVATSFKEYGDILARPPKFIFAPTLRNYVTLLFSGEGLRATPFSARLLNSVIIASFSTVFAVALGTMTAYAFSRFRTRGQNDWQFFILSTRMLPPVVVVIPIFLMYRALGLFDTHVGLIVLYTAFNVSFAVWLLKGFMDEIPKEYEEAALVDGYSRLQAFVRIVLPQAVAGIAATSVFCLITAWNEFAFALVLTQKAAQTAPPFIPSVVGSGATEWGRIAAGTVVFLLPVAIFTFLMRKHLLRGATFGALKR